MTEKITLNSPQSKSMLKSKLGRPPAGSEAERLGILLDHALKIFMRDGYGLASIGKIASAAGVSTRTIYERYTNKADLMVASVAHMVGRDVEQMQSIEGLDAMTPEAGLRAFGAMMIARVTSPELIALYRMGVAEAARLPELASKMKASGSHRIQGVIADYLRQQVHKDKLHIDDVNKAAAMFCHMLVSEPRHQALLGLLAIDWDASAHISYVVDIFLHGVSSANIRHMDQVNNNEINA